MPTIDVPAAGLSYQLIAFDADGQEREPGNGELTSRRVEQTLRKTRISDVFIFSHGWRGDVRSAKKQYDAWITAMADCADDRKKLIVARPDFRPLLIGVHWPSEPWGDEELRADGSYGAAARGSAAWLMDRFSERLGDTETVRAALQTIFRSMNEDAAPSSLPEDVVQAYRALDHASGLGSNGPGGGPSDDRDQFDPQSIYREALEEGEVAFDGFSIRDAMLMPARLLSFWRMKDRGLRIGEGGGHTLLKNLQQAATERQAANKDDRTRFHLMGHSFGCIVVSAMVAGPGGRGTLVHPVDSLVLVQGAFSLWSYCNDIPVAKGTPGYFRSILSDGNPKVNGPVVTTQSTRDRAVGRYYPSAAWARGDVSYGRAGTNAPKYGSVGTHGLQGPGLEIINRDMLQTTEPYFFEPGKIYNLESSRVINEGGWPSGAHSDIAKPAVAHAVWEAAWGSERMLSFNGVNCSTGAYIMPPRPAADVSKIAQAERIDEELRKELKWRVFNAQTHYGTMAGVDVKDLAQAGWGVIFAQNADTTIKDALGPLLEHRKRQASAKDPRRYRVYDGPDGYRPGETKDQFLKRHGSAPGPVNPDKMPYYLLIVGDPEAIPFSFQSSLDVANAVGRIHFDSIDEYASYARSVVTAETGEHTRPRRAVFFGTQNPADEPTSLSANHLVKPLADWLQIDQPDWKIETSLKGEATKQRLLELLGGDLTPALLFTATHGACFDRGDPLQERHQGALLCQEWPGPFALATGQSVPIDHYLSGDQIGEARPHGLISFHFACYGAGTPRHDEFAHRQIGAVARETIADRPFVADLPKKLLGHRNGGALAVVGHVERAWGCSFTWGGRTREQLSSFQSALKWMTEGYPIGAALDFFNQRYADLSTSLSAELEEIRFGRNVDDYWMAELWTANNDARGYIVIGDPAVKLSVDPNRVDDSRVKRDQTDRIADRSATTGVTKVFTSGTGTRSSDVESPSITSDVPEAKPVSRPPDSPLPHEPAGPREGATPASLADSRTAYAAQTMAERLAHALDLLIGTPDGLTISTSVSDDPMKLRQGLSERVGKTPQALTRLRPNGDVDTVLPPDAQSVDADLWSRHLDIVEMTQADRTERLRAAVDALIKLRRRPEM